MLMGRLFLVQASGESRDNNIYLSFVHLIVGAGSPTELQGRRTSFIHGVVTVPPKDRILAGTVHIKI